ncbi:MAG: ABC transporter permease [Planctomycetes bacterium]|nr:ABC transporter permease [Planctomycetota bacterium]
MEGIGAVVRSGFGAVLLHPARSAAVVLCVTALLLPFTAGAAVSEGLADQAADAARLGPDLLVTGIRYGRPAPIPLAAVERVRALEGVASATPRIVAHLTLGAAEEPAVVVGLPAGAIPPDVRCVEGRLFAAEGGQELVIGSRLAARLALEPGALLPPFFSNREGQRVSKVVGVFRSGLPIWESHVMLCSLETAQALFDERGTANQILVDCRDGYEEPVRRAIRRLGTLGPPGEEAPLAPRVVSREEGGAVLASGAAFGAGVFSLHFVLLFAAAVPLLVVATGAGLRERRRETGVLKMLGWGTDEVLIRGFVESLVLAALGASLAVLLAALWLGPLGARGIAAVLLPGADADPGFAVPWRLAPGPVLAAAAVSLLLVLTGTLPSSWRAAAAEPMESMR